jgi:DNA adenine methylase
MKPPFPYYGGKTRIADQIVAMMPRHLHYVEPFAGALSVLLAKPRSPLETVNDKNEDLVNFFRVLREQTDDLTKLCALTPHSRVEHALSRHRDDVSDLERARRTFVNLSQGRSASLRKTGWAHVFTADSYGRAGSRAPYLQSMVGRFADIANRLLDVSLECRDALDIIRIYGAHPDVLLYVDPPYLNTTRTSQGYEHEFGRRDQHDELLQALLDCKATVMLSGYASPLYSETLAGWQETRIHGSRTQRNQPTVELVWSNRVLRRDLPAPMIGQAVAGTQMGLLDPPQEVITE